MTDIVVTAANVLAGTNSIRKSGTCGETIPQGKVVVLNPLTGKWVLADNNSATAALRGAEGNIGYSLTSGALNQPIVVHVEGDITVGGTMTAGLGYFLSDTPGGFGPVADVGSAEYVVQLGLAKSATVLTWSPKYTGVAN